MWCRRSSPPVGRPGRRDRVQRVADGAVADRVQVHLEALGVEPGHRRRAASSRSTKRDAAVVRVPAAAVAVGLEQGAGVVLQHPVQHDLHRRGVEAAAAARPRLAPRAAALDLLDALRPLPPQRADDARGEPAVRRQRLVGGLRRRRHPRVLPAGDAERVQVPLRAQDRGLPVRPVGGGTSASLTAYAAPSWSMPVGSPVSGSRSMRPSGGSGVSRSMPASSSVRS